MNRAKSYWRHKHAAALIGFAVSLAYLIFLQLSGASRLFCETVRRTAPDAYLSDALYLLLFWAAYSIVMFPLRLYEGFLLERRFSLSDRSFGSWLADDAKAGAVSGICFIILVEAFYAMARLFPDGWWLAAALFWIGVSIIAARIFPVVIIPLFYRYKKLSNDELKRSVLAIADRFKVKVMDVFEIDLSRTTRKANAAVVGWGTTRRIILADNLVNQFTPAEVAVVVAHEIAHHKRLHMWKLLAFGAASIIVFFFLLKTLVAGLFGPAGASQASDIAFFPTVYMLFIVYELVMMPIHNAFSRMLETEADVMALGATGSKGDFISMMTRLGEKNLADIAPSAIIKWFFYSHPPIGERIARAAQENM